MCVQNLIKTIYNTIKAFKDSCGVSGGLNISNILVIDILNCISLMFFKGCMFAQWHQKPK